MAVPSNEKAAHMSDEEFMELFEQFGAAAMARETGYSERRIHARRRSLEHQYGLTLRAPNRRIQGVEPDRTARLEHQIEDGSVIIFSDAHYWPQLIPTIHVAICEIAEELNPQLVIANGDIFDGSSQSRHARINWEETPSTIEEVYACQARLAEIEAASPEARKIWTLGNHDARFESYVANNAPEMAKVHGVHLKDHFPQWETAWSVWINEEVVVKHRWHGGIHAAYNNTVKSGKTIVTGHTHQLNVRPHTDYNGTRFGIECGTCSEPNGPQYMAYTEDNPKNWVSAAVVLTFEKGRMLYPEAIRRLDEGTYEFRGIVREIGGHTGKAKKGKTTTRTSRSTGQRKRTRAKDKSSAQRNGRSRG